MAIFKNCNTYVVSRLKFLVDGWQHIMHVPVTVGFLAHGDMM